MEDIVVVRVLFPYGSAKEKSGEGIHVVVWLGLTVGGATYGVNCVVVTELVFDYIGHVDPDRGSGAVCRRPIEVYQWHHVDAKWREE